MASLTRIIVLVAVFAALATFSGRADDKPASAPAPKTEKIADALARSVTVDKAFEGTFDEAVQYLIEKYQLPITIDPTVRSPEAEEKIIVKIPALKDVRVRTLLQTVCDRARVSYLVDSDRIRIVGIPHQAYESGWLPTRFPEPGQEEAPVYDVIDFYRTKPLSLRALVTASYKEKTIDAILDDIGETTGATVVLSPQASVLLGKKTFTARFANSPVDATIRTLAEMADLGVITDANVLLVTTRERVAERANEEQKRRPQPINHHGLGGLVVPQLIAEVAQLKDQNELLKKQMEELLKLLKK